MHGFFLMVFSESRKTTASLPENSRNLKKRCFSYSKMNLLKLYLWIPEHALDILLTMKYDRRRQKRQTRATFLSGMKNLHSHGSRAGSNFSQHVCFKINSTSSFSFFSCVFSFFFILFHWNMISNTLRSVFHVQMKLAHFMAKSLRTRRSQPRRHRLPSPQLRSHRR